MTFGIGTIDYSDMYVAEARTIAGAQRLKLLVFHLMQMQMPMTYATLDAGKQCLSHLDASG